MYSRVPPPEQQDTSTEKGALGTDKVEEASTSPPTHISQEQWERFQKLKGRKAELCKGKKQRVNAMRKKTLDQVGRDLTEQDKRILIEEGVTLPAAKRRKRHFETRGNSNFPSSSDVPSVNKWKELQKYFDPNPQLRSHYDEGVSAEKEKSGLERALDRAVQEGEFEKAASISDNMATRHLASKVATAFDCVEYVQRQKMEKEKKKQKPAKLKWSFEQKKRWETKGNM